MGNMSYNNFNNYNNFNQNPSMMNMNGKGYPSNERRDYNSSNFMGNRYQSDEGGFRKNFNFNNNYMNNTNFSNSGSPGFKNMMRSNNNYLQQHPRGSAFDNQNYRRFNESNLNLNNPY